MKNLIIRIKNSLFQRHVLFWSIIFTVYFTTFNLKTNNELITVVVFIVFLFLFTLTLLPPILLFLTKYKLNRAKTIENVNLYLDDIDSNEKDICLILRPFGNDGSIIVPSNGFMTYFFPNINYTIEEIIKKCFLKKEIETIAVRNPDQIINVGGVKNIKVSNVENWKNDVGKLITRAAYIIFVFPPKSDISDSVKWEINLAIKKGLVSRLLFIFPSKENQLNDVSYKVMSELEDFFPNLSFSYSKKNLESTVLFHPEGNNKYFIVIDDTIENDRKGIYNESYISSINKFISYTYRQFKSYNFNAKYPYYRQRNNNIIRLYPKGKH